MIYIHIECRITKQFIRNQSDWWPPFLIPVFGGSDVDVTECDPDCY